MSGPTYPLPGLSCTTLHHAFLQLTAVTHWLHFTATVLHAQHRTVLTCTACTCMVLYCMHCNVLPWTTAHFVVLHCTAMYAIHIITTMYCVLPCTVMHDHAHTLYCTTCTALYYHVLMCTALYIHTTHNMVYCIVLPCTA